MTGLRISQEVNGLLQNGFIQLRVGQKPLEAGILLFQSFQPLGLTDAEPSLLSFPAVISLLTDA